MSSVAPLQNDKHGKLRIIDSDDFRRYKDSHLVPVITQDFFVLAVEFPLVFVKNGSADQFVPVAVMGLREGHNLYCQTATWKAEVVPARFSSAPFSLAKVDPEGKQLGVLIDEGSEMLSETDGIPLFNADGKKSAYLEKRVEQLVSLAHQTEVTEDFCKIIAEKGLLVTQELKLQHRQDSPRFNIAGVYTIDEKKLNALTDEEFLDLRRQGLIPLIYAHLASLQQLRRISAMQYAADNSDTTAKASQYKDSQF